MNSKVLPIAILFALSMTGYSFARDQQADGWSEDVDYLVRRIEIMHPNPYAYIPKEKFYQLKNDLQDKIPGMSEADIVISIMRLVATLQDGHTRLSFVQSDPQWLNERFHLLPILFYPFKDGVFVLAGLEKYKDLVGSKVLRIGSMPIAEVTSRLGKFWSHDNTSGERKYLYYALGIAEMLKAIGAVNDTTEIELELQFSTNEKSAVLLPIQSLLTMAPHYSAGWYPQDRKGLAVMNERAENPTSLWMKNPRKKFWYEYLPEDKIMYLQINSLNFPHPGGGERGPFGRLCDDFFTALDQSNAEKVVIDIRWNNGGNHVEQPLLKGFISRPRFDKAGRLFLITGRVTYSAAVHFTTLFKKHTHVTIVGEPCSGRPNHFGAVRTFRLPHHHQILIHCSIDYYQDSEPFDFNVTHTPDIGREMTADHFRNNADPSLQAVRDYELIFQAVESLKQDSVQGYGESGIQGLKKAYQRNKQALLETGYSRENFFKELYELIFAQQKDNEPDLIDFLSFVSEECPESIDLCFAFANRLESAGRMEEAKTHYRRCLMLNPTCHYARIKLELMELDIKR
jgi:hypothetical protein